MNGKPYLKFEQIGMSFHRGNASTEVLRDIDLAIAQGEFVSLIGHSGCGKSTVLSMVAKRSASRRPASSRAKRRVWTTAEWR